MAARRALWSDIGHRRQTVTDTHPAEQIRALAGVQSTHSGRSGIPRSHAFDAMTYLVLVLMGGIGTAGIDGVAPRIASVLLCIAYGALIVWASRAARSPRSYAVALALATVAVVTAMRLGSDTFEAFGFLLMLLAVRAAIVLRPPSAACWGAALWGLHCLSSPDLGPAEWLVVGFNFGIYLACGAFGYTVRRLYTAKADLEHTMTSLEQAQAQIAHLAVTAERRRLSQDLHDSVKQQVFAAGMQIGAARSMIRRDLAAADDSLLEADRLTRRAGAELNLVIHELQPSAGFGGVGLRAALETVTTRWSRRSGVTTVLDVCADVRTRTDCSRSLAVVIRVVEEALANVERHSGASAVRVAVDCPESRISVLVIDDGCGFDTAAQRSGLGLQTMAERVQATDGTLQVTSSPGAGTRVYAEVGGAAVEEDTNGDR
ncbi:sensor histidine kinase [Gordonia sp. (in: high G+C Gram-positive bacteria)]|uniref:sensor histidine kinase n=1 Tax=Gordonia sp. (in: high G+C Gram-positive bacteria) TaxID=84139 RepID=UPI003F95F8E5